MHFENVLLIDDDEEDTEIFVTAMREVSTKVACRIMYSASEALQKLESGEIEPEVIFLDLNMPIMNGQKFLEEIKKNPDLRDIPVIIFSTSSQPGTIRLTKELGAYDFITKPESFDGLVKILNPIFAS